MELKLQFTGSAEGLINYLENFAKIRPTLLLEVDVKERAFIAKGLVEDRSSIRYSSLKFEDANIAFVSDNFEHEDRIQIGILNQLDKLIKIIKRFDSELTITPKEGENPRIVDFTIKYGEDFSEKGDSVLAAISLNFKSKILSMRCDCFSNKQFKIVTDEQFFNGVYKVSNATEFNLTQETIKNIIATTDIIANNPKEDLILFRIDNNEVRVSDKKDAKEERFNMHVDNVETVSDFTEVAIKREAFLKMLGKPDGDYRGIIGYKTFPDGKSGIDRVLFSSVDNNTKIVISSVNID